MIAKLEKHLETYKEHFERNEHYSPWLAAEIRRYKVIHTHLAFLRRNRAYWKRVHEYLCEELTDGSFTLHLHTKSDKTREGTS